MLNLTSQELLDYLIEFNNRYNYIKNHGTFTKTKTHLVHRQKLSQTDRALMILLIDIKEIVDANITDEELCDIGETILLFEELGEEVFILLNTPHDTSEDIDFESQWLTPEEEQLLLK